MKNHTDSIIIRVGGIESIFWPREKVQAVLDRRTNMAMRMLYDQGIRKMSIHRLPRTGDDIKIMVRAA